MRIRSITVGQQQAVPVRKAALQRAGEFLGEAVRVVEGVGFEVQTKRLETQPVTWLMRRRVAGELAGVMREVERESKAVGFEMCSVGPVLASAEGSGLELIGEIPGALAGTESVFTSVMAATSRAGINFDAVWETAKALTRIGQLDAQGAAARRFCLSANVAAHGPFFPSGYHSGREDSFSVAIEAADLAVEAFDQAKTLKEARARLVRSLTAEGRKVTQVCSRLEARYGVMFRGLDISLAPFPEQRRDIAFALEQLGVSAFGANGTLFAAAFITDVLKTVNLPTCGFSGLMIPLLEDSTMARRHAEGAYGINDLLLYSTVCGTGLDTIPIAGDATVEQIASVYLDVCTLAVKLQKPLTARLMPIKGKKAGERTSFDFPFFAPTTVAEMKGRGSAGLFGKGNWRMGG